VGEGTTGAGAAGAKLAGCLHPRLTYSANLPPSRSTPTWVFGRIACSSSSMQPLSSPDRRTLVRLSLNPAFRRRWPRTCDALSDGTHHRARRRLFLQTLPPAPARPGWIIDGSHWPRPRAATSPTRTCEWHLMAGQPQHHLVHAWA
jgi:hypothetical protein